MTLFGKEFELLQVGIADHLLLLLCFGYWDVDGDFADFEAFDVTIFLDPPVGFSIDLNDLFFRRLLILSSIIFLPIFILVLRHKVLLNVRVVFFNSVNFLLGRLFGSSLSRILLLHFKVLVAKVNLISEFLVFYHNFVRFLVFLSLLDFVRVFEVLLASFVEFDNVLRGNDLADEVAPFFEVLLLLFELKMSLFLIRIFHQLVQFAIAVLFMELFVKCLNIFEPIFLFFFFLLNLFLDHLGNASDLFKSLLMLVFLLFLLHFLFYFAALFF